MFNNNLSLFHTHIRAVVVVILW